MKTTLGKVSYTCRYVHIHISTLAEPLGGVALAKDSGVIGCELEREGELAKPPGSVVLAEDSGVIGCELEREGELAEPPGGTPPLGAG